MQQTVLVPLDGSPFAEQALPTAVALARRLGADLDLLMVVTPGIAPRFSEHMTETEATRHEEARQGAKAYLEGVGARLAAESGITPSLFVGMGPITEAIERHVQDHDVSLVVLTSHGRGTIQRAWLGSVTDGLVRRAPVPVLVVRPQDGGAPEGAGTFRRVLIPLDGSPAARAILAPALDLLGTEGVLYILARVVVAHAAVSTYLPHMAEENRRIEEARAEATELLAQRKAELEARGATVETRIVDHTGAAHAILALAEEAGADLIAMTTEGRGGIGRLLVGSVADKVIRGSSLPILVARREG